MLCAALYKTLGEPIKNGDKYDFGQPPAKQCGITIKMTTNNRSFSGPWTNEMHVHFLNSMEASFVRTMLENDDGHRLRLDRYLPDTSDSTLDLKTQRRQTHATSSGPRSGVERRTRQHQSYQPYTSSHDQVVPQIGNRSGDKDESDSSDAPAKAS